MQALYFKNIGDRFGTKRIYLTYCFHRILYRLGFFRRYYNGIDLTLVKRLVFVCKGNIYRSAFSEVWCSQRGIPVASFGLDARDGKRSPDQAIACAKELSTNMLDHRATNFSNFNIAPNDLVVVMDYRQLREAKKFFSGCDIQFSMLGLWDVGSTCPIVLDPYGRSDDFCKSVFQQLELCLENLTTKLL